ncbi:hypothetical protein [Pararhodospirillum oryzae]|uniref:Lipoprotein n=1 Tax=Pararhodospirillum oryzae TaxID=478448 RepID=A0A512HBS8_9PROT|nr:hypothetical protein [Pararhodospirillum oryzae]GEO82895.1 hypothetical protein ROR02_30260 [Pararhodospirillum oryzae]
MSRSLASLAVLGTVAALPLALAACAGPVPVAVAMFPPALVATDAATMSLTGKTVIDGAYSWATGRDCSTLRAMDGDYYCRQELPDNRIIETKLYCYRSLASVDCYAKPQPYRQNQQIGATTQVVGARSQGLNQ